MTIGAVKNTTLQTRLLAVLSALLLALCIGMLAGCGGSGGQSSSAAAESSSSADQVHATVAVDFTEAEGKVETVEVAVDAGSSVLDATVAANFELDVQDSQYGKFVNAINGVATGDHGDMSGWLVAVNGEDLTVSADAQEVAEGDEIAWRYVTSFE